MVFKEDRFNLDRVSGFQIRFPQNPHAARALSADATVHTIRGKIIDLVFYHAVLKCYVLIDLKVGKLAHQDIGQLELYVNYFDQERLTAGDNPSLGLILCTDKNDAVVRYTLGPEKEKKIFTSRYKLYLPTEEELKAELKRELVRLGWPKNKP